MNLNEHLPALLLAVPLLGAFTAPLFSLGGKYLRNAALLAATFLTLVVAFLLWRHVSATGIAVYVMGGKTTALTLPSGMKFPVRIILEVDAFSAFMALTGAIASFAGALFSLNYMNRFTGLNRFVSLYCLLTAGMLGMMVTGDLFNFFVFFEVASIASFGLIAFWRDKPEAIEASFKYALVSQVGYMLLGLGVGLLVLPDPAALASYGLTAISGGIYHMFNYTMYKALLFLTAGAIYYATGKRDLNEMGGLARKMPYTTFMFVIAAAAISGLPPFNGFVSKLLIYESVFAIHPALTVVALLTSVLTLASFVKVFQTAFLGPQKFSLSGVKEVPTGMLLGMTVLTVAIIGASLFPTWTLSHLVEPAARALVDQGAYIGAVMGGGM